MLTHYSSKRIGRTSQLSSYDALHARVPINIYNITRAILMQLSSLVDPEMRRHGTYGS